MSLDHLGEFEERWLTFANLAWHDGAENKRANKGQRNELSCENHDFGVGGTLQLL